MLKPLLTFFLTLLTTSKIEILQPLSLQTALHNNLKYSLSTFGDILYSKKTEVLLITPEKNNQTLCKPIKLPQQNSLKIIILAKRGECTYSKKASIAQESGAHAVMVYHTDPLIDVENIIPCSDSICFLKR